MLDRIWGVCVCVPTHKHVANVCVRVSRRYHATVHAGEEHGLGLIRQEGLIVKQRYNCCV